MALVDFNEQLEAAESVLDLAGRLGELCLSGSDDLGDALPQPGARRELKVVEALAGRASLAAWEAAVAEPASLAQQLGPDLVAAVKRARARQPLEFLGILRGLCVRPLTELFMTTTERIELRKGLPLPFADRDLPWAASGDLPAKQETLNDQSLLHPRAFELYTHVPEEELRVVLDFSHADDLDAVTWEKKKEEEERLPLIATLHPEGGGEFEFGRPRPNRFFNVRPQAWDVEAIKDLLIRAKAAGARVAVLPELSLPSPDALEQLLARDPGAYPPIVVAGSAHAKVSEPGRQHPLRVNESRVYLEGKQVLAARKIKPFRFRKLGEKRYKKLQWEDLTQEPKTITVLAGREHTRLGVVICADLQEKGIPRLLVDAGVNLLLTPAMTPRIGSFTPALSGIAGYCQGVAAIANTRFGDDGKPFLCMCAVPRAHPGTQVGAQTGDGNEPAPELAILDPNQPLPEAISWPGREKSGKSPA